MQFYKNLRDNNHCFQASFKMVLSKYYPKKNFSYEEVDRIVGFDKNPYVWDSRGLMWLAKKGFEILRISEFDYKTFSEKGTDYLKGYWSKEAYDYQTSISDIKSEQKKAKKSLVHIKNINRDATIKDVEKLFKQKYTLIVAINPNILDKKKGYGNHSVVIVDILKNHIIFHDPGLPPEPNRKVTKNLFKKALNEITAIKKIG